MAAYVAGHAAQRSITAMPFTQTLRDYLLEQAATKALFMSLHTGHPGENGASELSGGTPAYARQPVTWVSPVSGQQLALAGSVIFNIPAGVTVVFAGLWDAVSGGTFQGFGPSNGGGLAGFGYADNVTDAVFSVANGLIAGDVVYVTPPPGGALPSPLSAVGLYAVSASPDLNAFKLETYPAAVPVDMLASGALQWQRCVPESFTGQGTLQIAGAYFDLGA